MYRYFIRRILLMIPTLLGVAIVVFVLMRLIPGDIVELRLSGEGGMVDQGDIDAMRAQLGLDKPVIMQFLSWLWGAIQFDFGNSMWTGRPLSLELEQRFQLTVQVALMASFFSVIIAIPLGTIAALRQDTWVDYAVRIFSIAGIATPGFWLGILIILGFLIFFQWMPPIKFVPFYVDPWENMIQLIWPALATGYRYSAVATRMTRSTVLEVLREDYIRTARAKGLVEQVVLVRHALKNAMLPVITVIGLEFAFLIGGLVVTEQVFNLNGLGKYFVESVANFDYTGVQALVMIVATTVVVMNFLVDITYAWLDPRIRYQ
ncbi:MAG: ABC transporter permease [SAR324 cluster bacterium]|nr:ABC transporter permease [SAR324 cluster bacterium]